MSVVSSTVGGDDLIMYGETSGNEEKILVSVRLRPLNEREMLRNEVSDWECINNTTIIFKSNLPERSMFPTSYTFDRVFSAECPTKQVYEEGAKEIVLLAISGINSTIFAYGQTSSGKTYTMRGITEYAFADLFEYIERNKEREFALKFSAMEIYNEAVRDLLSTETTPLRLLDDPERGTIVEKLTEETLIDRSHLQELLFFCEAQRQIGETSLNETSSRSHQILRLTVESSAREYSDAWNSSFLTATVNFVDLAGSERASQTLAAGTRLKEGSHINRSLLTLGTVIRKLSKGRNGHIPYRDSKLTRILQHSLGGNARTAIICTMSPARSHVEQSRNALLFASCANEVTTNAQVNVVMSDKVLVKQLQKELARLESRLRSTGSNSLTDDSAALLREKELQIEKMEKEIQELTRQRDRAISHVQSLLKSVGQDHLWSLDDQSASKYSELINSLWMDVGLPRIDTFKDFDRPTVVTSYKDTDDSSRKFSGGNVMCIGERNNEESEDIFKGVQGTEMEESRMNTKNEADVLLPAASEEKEERSATKKATNKEGEASSSQEDDEKLIHINSKKRYNPLKEKVQELHEAIDHLEQSPSSYEEEEESSSKRLKWDKSKSRRSVFMTISSALLSDKEEHDESVSPIASGKDFHQMASGFDQKLPQQDAKHGNMSQEDSQNSLSYTAVEEEIVKDIDVDVEDTNSVLDFVAGVNKPKLQSGNQIADVQAVEASRRRPHANWHAKYERYRRKIIDLWFQCNVPLVHRSYFFLLFKGDASDNVYMEVELRRLYYLKDTFSRGTSTIIDGKIASPESSLRALNRERDMLAKQFQKKYTRTERERLYHKWGIDLDTKQRSLQLARCLWTDSGDLRHIRESAALVAKLMGLVEPRNAPKEIFGLSFVHPSTNRRFSSWRDNMSSLL